MYSKSVCEGECTGVLHLQENVRFFVFKKTEDRPLSCVFLFLRKQGTDRFRAFFLYSKRRHTGFARGFLKIRKRRPTDPRAEVTL